MPNLENHTRDPILFWDRNARCTQSERVYGEGLMRWLYETRPGCFLEKAIFSRRLFTQIYGYYNDSKLSARKIPGFIKDFQIPMHEFEEIEYRSFNEFFIRRFKSDARVFTTQPNEMPAFAEGRYVGFENVKDDQLFPVKGKDLAAAALLGDAESAKPFVGGSVLVARLCPTDYHRFHYPDDGIVRDSYRVAGVLHSVSPVALKSCSETFAVNERVVSILETKSFGRVAYIEVGALCVGKIVQTNPERKNFLRGDEKGYFLFGGSTVILLGEPGAWTPAADILEQTKLQRETFVPLGECVATLDKSSH